MSVQPSSLANQLAGLRAATTSNDDRGWLPAPLHALIMACLARIFSRLEQILQLLQTGQLPQIQSQTRDTSHPPSHRNSRNAPVPHAARQTTRLAKWDQKAPGPSRESVPHAPPPEARLFVRLPCTHTAPAPRPHPAHDPPAAKIAAQRSKRPHFRVTYLLRFWIIPQNSTAGMQSQHPGHAPEAGEACPPAAPSCWRARA